MWKVTAEKASIASEFRTDRQMTRLTAYRLAYFRCQTLCNIFNKCKKNVDLHLMLQSLFTRIILQADFKTRVRRHHHRAHINHYVQRTVRSQIGA